MSRSKKPLSVKRLLANRANASRSTGPRTPEGKACSAQNARKHGFRAAEFAVVRLEELDSVARLKADLLAVYRPVNPQELFALERIALAQQALIRAARLETGLFTCCLNEVMDYTGEPFILISNELIRDIEVTRAQNRNYGLAEGFHRMVRRANSWSLFLRYQAQAERHYRRAAEEFQRLRALREELPNEPIIEVQPDENETTSTPLETNPAAPQAHASSDGEGCSTTPPPQPVRAA
jgi:hypothetical protein